MNLMILLEITSGFERVTILDRIIVVIATWIFIYFFHHLVKTKERNFFNIYFDRMKSFRSNLVSILAGIFFILGGITSLQIIDVEIDKNPGTFFLGAYLGAIGFLNLIGIFVPMYYILYWEGLTIKAEAFLFPLNLLVIWPVLSILSALLVIEIPRVNMIVSSNENFWNSVLDISLLIAIVAQFRLLFRIIREDG